MNETVLLEFMNNTYNRLENDYQTVKNRISIYEVNARDYHDLIVCETRLDYASSLFRQIREILKYC